MRSFFIFLAMILGLPTASLLAKDRPVVKSNEAAKYVGSAATVYGRVIEIRRVADGPIIFEIDGQPSAPVFRALVYPMAVARFGSDPETLYLGKEVEITGAIVTRRDLPQTWISDPSHIRLRKTESTPTP